jgi:hypothetical protein
MPYKTQSGAESPRGARPPRALRHGVAKLRRPSPPCKDSRLVRPLRPTLVALVCSALLLVQGSGVHVHRVAADPHEAGAAHAHESGAQAHHHEAVVSDHDLDHAAAHFDGGAADLDSAKLPGKGSAALTLLAVSSALPLVALLPAARPVAMPSGTTVPIRRSRFHLLPPSQAPPLTG